MKQTMNAQQISDTLDCGLTQAYKIIKQLNAELTTKGYITIRGKVSTKYFTERFYGCVEEGSDSIARSD